MTKIEYILMSLIFIAGFSGILMAQELPLEEPIVEPIVEAVVQEEVTTRDTSNDWYVLHSEFGVFEFNTYRFISDSCIVTSDKKIFCGSFMIYPMSEYSDQFIKTDLVLPI